MKKILIAMLLFAILAIAFVLSLAWSAGYKWESGGKIMMCKDDRLIAIVEENAFSNTFACLSFSSGIIYHGQDTFELVKFRIEPDDPTWSVLSNRIYASREYVSCDVETQKNSPIGIPVHLEDLATSEEVLVGRLDIGKMSLYITREKDTKEQFVYLEGILTSASNLGRR